MLLNIAKESKQKISKEITVKDILKFINENDIVAIDRFHHFYLY